VKEGKYDKAYFNSSPYSTVFKCSFCFDWIGRMGPTTTMWLGRWIILFEVVCTVLCALDTRFIIRTLFPTQTGKTKIEKLQFNHDFFFVIIPCSVL